MQNRWYSHFIDVEIEAKRSLKTCLRSHSKSVVEKGYKIKSTWPKILFFSTKSHCQPNPMVQIFHFRTTHIMAHIGSITFVWHGPANRCCCLWRCDMPGGSGSSTSGSAVRGEWTKISTLCDPSPDPIFGNSVLSCWLNWYFPTLGSH